MGSQQVVTLWFITAADPRAVLAAEPAADRGYARKLLAQLNPAWPLTHIGDFDMNRSAPPGDGEFYIGGYRGLTVVQTVLPDVPHNWSLSGLPQLTEPFAPFASLTRMIPTADLLVTVHTPGNRDGLGGFAHWVGGRMTRCFYATREHIIEDTGLPLPAEAAFWEGDTEAHGIELPFRPSEMAAAAVTHWLGFRVSDEIDIPVAAFAIDGRPEVRTGRPGDLPVPAVPAGHRELVGDVDVLRDLVAGQCALAELTDVPGGQRCGRVALGVLQGGLRVRRHRHHPVATVTEVRQTSLPGGCLPRHVCERHAENMPHGHPHDPPVQRVGATGTEKHRTDTQPRRIAEQGADVLVVPHTFEDADDAVAGVQSVEHLGDGGLGYPVGGSDEAAVHVESGDVGECLPVHLVERDTGETCRDSRVGGRGVHKFGQAPRETHHAAHREA